MGHFRGLLLVDRCVKTRVSKHGGDVLDSPVCLSSYSVFTEPHLNTWLEGFSEVNMQLVNCASGLVSCVEFCQYSSCLNEDTLTRKKVLYY